ncbi:glycosyltransferase family 4 protein [Paenibacillus sp. YN15]|uniref:glycosyltransferase family 4 protein n=1 Tax=Paenibacillus sp. YN15 TaxID=1742774 RepID=UPI000DCBD1EF|nr:glycosyltransferase family 4 protein [Paenibacillus sp. YN15]RAV05090.1 glycosyltransferase family 4 protein [Paenibacillus sp. YN15]
MKIGLFTDTYYPQINGVATSVLMHKKFLEMLGHQVYVFTTTDPRADPHEPGVFRVTSLPFASSRRIGIFIHPKAISFIRRLGLDAIHTHTEFSLGIVGRTLAKLLKIPFLHTYHTIYENYTHYIVKFGVLEPAAKKLARSISTRFCNSADQVIVPTEKVRSLLLSYGVRPDIGVIPTPIDVSRFGSGSGSSAELPELRASLGIEDGDKVLLYIGRMAKEKNVDLLLQHLQDYLLLAKEPVKLLLVGDGPERKRLEEIAEEYGIAHRTIFAGEVLWDRVCLYYRLGDVFVNASQSETQGITYTEALASGLPVVAMADPCLEGVIRHGANGFVFQEQADFIRYVEAILGDRLMQERMSAEACRSVSELTGIRFAKDVEGLYRETIARAYMPVGSEKLS